MRKAKLSIIVRCNVNIKVPVYNAIKPIMYTDKRDYALYIYIYIYVYTDIYRLENVTVIRRRQSIKLKI
jgi:hypothetical protein